jgi:hypothetical protein
MRIEQMEHGVFLKSDKCKRSTKGKYIGKVIHTAEYLCISKSKKGLDRKVELYYPGKYVPAGIIGMCSNGDVIVFYREKTIFEKL